MASKKDNKTQKNKGVVYGQDNINYHAGSHCPALGLPFRGTEYLRNNDLNKKLLEEAKFNNSYDLRMYLQKNAVKIMKRDFERMIDTPNTKTDGVHNRCKFDPHGETWDFSKKWDENTKKYEKQVLSKYDTEISYKKYISPMKTNANDPFKAYTRAAHTIEVDEY